MDKNYIFLKHKTIMTQSFISQNLAGGGVKIYRLIIKPLSLVLGANTQRRYLPMELKSTDSLLMTYTINNVSGFTCYTTQTNTVVFPLWNLSALDGEMIGIPMFKGTEKKFIGMNCWPDENALVYMRASSESTDITLIINDLYLLR